MNGLIFLVGLSLSAASGADVNQWTNIGPSGGPIAFLVADPQNAGTFYAGGNGLFQSTDGAASWSNTGLIGLNVRSLVIDPQNSATLYALISGPSDSDSTLNIFKSVDSGATWNEADSGLPTISPRLDILAIDPQNTGTLYLLYGGAGEPELTTDLLFQSTDGGASWTQTGILPSGFEPLALAVDPQNSGTLYIAADGLNSATQPTVAVFKSQDGGANWNEWDSGLPTNTGPFGTDGFANGGLAIDPKNSNILYVTRLGSGVYKTTDGGALWTPANTGLPNQVGQYQFQSCCVTGVVIDPQNTATIYAEGATGAIYKSTNGGGVWVPINQGMGRSWLSQLAINPQNTSIVYGLAANAIYRSLDGGANFSAYSWMRNIPIADLAIDPQNSGTLYAGRWKSSDAGLTWNPIGSSIAPVALAIDSEMPDTLFGGTLITDDCCDVDGGDVFRTDDGAVSWVDTQAGVGPVVAIDPQNPNIVYAGSSINGGVRKSSDGGASWTAINTGLTAQPINAIAIDPQNTSTLYTGSNGVYKSTDGGATWNGINSGLPVLPSGDYATVNALALDPQTPGSVYAGTASGLFQTSDGGTSWQNLLPSLSTGIFALALSSQPAGQDTRAGAKLGVVYAGTDAGILKSTDGGGIWSPVPGAPPRIRLLQLDPQDPNTLYAGGLGGLFVITFRTPERCGEALRSPCNEPKTHEKLP
jgi:photosystem II stability/assembly factor-like uncharacterized protein